jgi:hypothetical protein
MMMKSTRVGFLALALMAVSAAAAASEEAVEPQWPNQKFSVCTGRVYTLLLSNFSKAYDLPAMSNPNGKLNKYGLELDANARNICRFFLAGEELQQ